MTGAAAGPSTAGRSAPTARSAATGRTVRAGRPTATGPPAPPPAAPTSRAALGLLRQGGDGLAEGHREGEPLLRYPAAYLAALRAAAAVLAVRARPRPKRGAPRDVWNL